VIPLFVRAIRSLQVPVTVKQHLHLKQRQCGFEGKRLVQTLVQAV
jgi:hypothetical protein